MSAYIPTNPLGLPISYLNSSNTEDILKETKMKLIKPLEHKI